MSEINYTQLEKNLKSLEKGGFPQVFLVHGEEALRESAAKTLVSRLLPTVSERNMNYEAIDNDAVPDALEKVNTFSLMGGTKVVALPDSRVFYARQKPSDFAEKAKAAWEADEMKKAARHFTTLLGLLNLRMDDLENRNSWEDTLKLDADLVGDGRWLDGVSRYCLDNKLSAAVLQDQAGALEASIRKGFPSGNHLLIVTDTADKRRTLYKTIAETGLVVDCSVPKGSSKADRSAQDAVLNETARKLLGPAGKRMSPPAFNTLREMTGFDPRTFSSNLEKLVAYTGDRPEITPADVEAVLKRTRQDPIYELTNAVADRNAVQALFYLDSLLKDGIFGLQVLAALTNQVRRLLVGCAFLESQAGRSTWRHGMTYNQFQQAVMSAVVEHDHRLAEMLGHWNEAIRADGEEPKAGGKKKRCAKPATDLIIAKNPKSAYPVYQTLMKAAKFRKTELMDAMERLSEVDYQLKTGGGGRERLLLERVIYTICRPEG